MNRLSFIFVWQKFQELLDLHAFKVISLWKINWKKSSNGKWNKNNVKNTGFRRTTIFRESNFRFVYLQFLISMLSPYVVEGEAVQHPCAWNSTHAQLLHDSENCHMRNVQIDRQFTSWIVWIIHNQDCDSIRIDLCFHHSQSPDVRDEFHRVSPFTKRFMSLTNGRLTQISITIHISHLRYCISCRQSMKHTVPDNVTLFTFLFRFHRITEHTCRQDHIGQVWHSQC